MGDVTDVDIVHLRGDEKERKNVLIMYVALF